MYTNRNATNRSQRRARFTATLLLIAGLFSLSIGASSTSVGAKVTVSAPTAEANAALDWLGSELISNGGTLPGFSSGSTDWGLTADAILAFVAGGRGGEAAPQLATDTMAANLDEYTTWDPDVPGVRVAGASAKALLVLLSQGRDVGNIDGVDLEAELRGLMLDGGDQIGRFSDRVPDPAWDASNGFGQALAMLALGLSEDGVPSESVGFLLDQQCPNGGFRLLYSKTPGCTTAGSTDTDATALAIQALLGVDRTATVRDALTDSIQWLLTSQDLVTGGWGGTGLTAAINANSTGLISQTLRAAGQVQAADRGSDWVTGVLQLNNNNSAGTPAASDIGAVAYNPAAANRALTDGIADQASDQWRRSTSQAVLAMGLAPFGRAGGPAVDVPPTTSTTSSTSTTSTTSTTTSTTPNSSTTTSVVGSGSAPPPSDEAEQALVGQRPGGGSALPEVESQQLTPSRTGSTGSPAAASADSRPSGTTRLARTGDDTSAILWLGLSLLLVGAVMSAVARRPSQSR